MVTITLSGNYGYKSYRLLNGNADVINASDASWTLANMGSPTNPYPFQVVNNDPAVRIIGGTINGQVSLTMDWKQAYVNSAAVRVDDTPQAIVEDWRITRAWDGIRVNGSSNGFRIDNVWLSDVRDDGIENDNGLSGTISNSLFDGVFVGISTADPNGINHTNNVVTLDDVLIRMETFLYKGMDTHQAPFKLYGTSPKMKIYDSVFAIEEVNHRGRQPLELAWDKTIDAHGNYFLNLSDTKLPSTYPKPPAGFTILQGQAARDFWAKARADWINEHGGTASVSTSTINTIVGTDNSETLTGTAQADSISARGGSDRLFGKDGNDILSGGSGQDKFVFDTGPDSGNVDKINDFLPGTDRIYLDNSIFAKLGSGSMSSPTMLNSSYFDGDGAADDSNDYIIYNRQTGALSYDANGSNSGAPVKFAEIGAGLALSHDDFFVV